MLTSQTLRVLLQASDAGLNKCIFETLSEPDISFLRSKGVSITYFGCGIHVHWGDLMLRDVLTA